VLNALLPLRATAQRRALLFGAKVVFTQEFSKHRKGRMRQTAHMFSHWRIIRNCRWVANAQVPSTQTPKYDLLLKKARHRSSQRIGWTNGRCCSIGRIAAVQKDIPVNQAAKVVDVSGLYVTPG